MIIKLFPDKVAMGQAAALYAAEVIRESVSSSGRARILLATGDSQLEFLSALVALPRVPWSKVEAFHLDEYIGLHPSHPAGFRRYLLDRVVSKTSMGRFYAIDGMAPPGEVCQELGHAINSAPIDMAFVGVGENGHLAFNDPPADIETGEPFIVVSLAEACRRQQVGEGWFKELEEVPRQAVTISMHQLLKARQILAIVPDARKAGAVQKMLEGPINRDLPASLLRRHADCRLYLDRAAASQTSPEVIARGAIN